eukprot:CAMPEP_0171898818 /NCGR_PEP_ID=MMETSP0992-20121227/48923_1 /TAXON_ID=483369 /ORGANISM="non described non described, Strain CCMP2098" /LENGTH=115 /DNA_ID=CAMNT_0012527141 /DNA_START=26 /DNA_END=373 /DNA_ORIENTATION=+
MSSAKHPSVALASSPLPIACISSAHTPTPQTSSFPAAAASSVFAAAAHPLLQNHVSTRRGQVPRVPVQLFLKLARPPPAVPRKGPKVGGFREFFLDELPRLPRRRVAQAAQAEGH